MECLHTFLWHKNKYIDDDKAGAKKIENLSRSKMFPNAIYFNVNVNLRTRKKRRRIFSSILSLDFIILITFPLHVLPFYWRAAHTHCFIFPRQFIIGKKRRASRLNIIPTTHYLNEKQAGWVVATLLSGSEGEKLQWERLWQLFQKKKNAICFSVFGKHSKVFCCCRFSHHMMRCGTRSVT